MYPHIIEICDSNLNKANVLSRNDFIEKAILFYSSYLNTRNNEYLNSSLDNIVRSNIEIIQDEISKTLFKQSVEINMLNHILATISDLDQETIDLLRKKSIREVKETSGKISLDDIVKNSDITK